MRHLIRLLVAAALVGIFAIPASAAAFVPVEMTYPLDGENRITDSFGDARGSRSHEGVDIMAAKGIPVLAAGAGVVTWISSGPSSCCFVGIDHGGGWMTRYIHLNDDTKDANGNFIPNTDGQGWGIAPGIVDGSQVTAGQLIGWVGDSGNAAEGVSHLHFELRKDGQPIDPYDYLVHAAAAWAGDLSSTTTARSTRTTSTRSSREDHRWDAIRLRTTCSALFATSPGGRWRRSSPAPSI